MACCKHGCLVVPYLSQPMFVPGVKTSLSYHFNTHNYVNSSIKHYKFQFSGKTRFLIPGTEHTCVSSESHESSDGLKLLTFFLTDLSIEIKMLRNVSAGSIYLYNYKQCIF